MSGNKTRQLILFIAIASVTLLSCTSIYYVGQATKSLKIYVSSDTASIVNHTIPVNGKVLIKKKSKKFHYVIYETYTGYVYKPYYTNYHKYNSSIDGVLYGYTSEKKKTAKTKTSKASSSGTVHVKGYYRKDGTYVKPHTRSAPKKRN